MNLFYPPNKNGVRNCYYAISEGLVTILKGEWERVVTKFEEINEQTLRV